MAASPVHQPHPPHFAVGFPSRSQEGGFVNSHVNTQFRQDFNEHPLRLQSPPTWQRFAISTDNDSLSSGFPYQHRLNSLGIMQDQWYQFTNEVINAAKLTTNEERAAWGSGIAAGTASFPFILVLGPVVGYYAGKAVHQKTMVKKVKEKLAQDGNLRSVLRRWNDGVFRERGMQIRLEPPFQSREVLVDTIPGMSKKDIEKATKKLAKRFTIVITPYDPQQSPISPLGQNPNAISPLYENQYHMTPQDIHAAETGLDELLYHGIGEPQNQSSEHSELPTDKQPLPEMPEAPSDLLKENESLPELSGTLTDSLAEKESLPELSGAPTDSLAEKDSLPELCGVLPDLLAEKRLLPELSGESPDSLAEKRPLPELSGEPAAILSEKELVPELSRAPTDLLVREELLPELSGAPINLSRKEELLPELSGATADLLAEKRPVTVLSVALADLMVVDEMYAARAP